MFFDTLYVTNILYWRCIKVKKLSKQYIKNVRALFPVVTKKEQDYLKKLSLNVEDYCEEHNICCIEELYKAFGSPIEIINSYYSCADVSYVLRQIRRTGTIKLCALIFVLLSFLGMSIYCCFLHLAHNQFEEQQMFIEDTFIEDNTYIE